MTNKSFDAELSRRSFMAGAAALAVAHSTQGRALERPDSGKTFAYVGTYTGAIGNGSNGEGIYLFEMDNRSGELLAQKLVAKTPNPSWIVLHPSKKYLYAVNEISGPNGHSDSVSAFAIDAASGNLRALNTVSSEGAAPCYLSIDATGSYAFVANYYGGNVAVLPILADGSLGAAVDIHRDSASLGSAQAADAPRGSFAVSGHEAPHAHMIAPDARNKFVLATDLGQDRIYIYRFDHDAGKLTPASGAPFTALPSGDGPRHFVFHPNGRWLYSIQEESSTVAFFHYDPETGSLASAQSLSTLPAGFAGTNFASAILLSPDGRFLYAANRLHDTIATFAIGSDGRLQPLGETSTMGDYPVQCRIDPSGRFLYACNRRSDCITTFKIDHATGRLSFTGRYTAVGTPASITFL